MEEIIEINNESGAISPIEAIERANIDMQIATAKKYPRSLKVVKDKMISTATLDDETAGACFYTLPARKGQAANKRIQGASVRLAEIAVASYGNIKAGARIISDDGKFITAQGVCHDVENNVSISVEVKRRITTKEGARYSDDMVAVTCQAACAIAYRNAVFKVVPLALVKPALDAAMKLARGDAKSLSERRGKMIDAFGKFGVEPERVLAAVNRAALEDITLDDITTLTGYYNSIKDGECSVEEIFPLIPAADPREILSKAMVHHASAAASVEPTTAPNGQTDEDTSNPQPSAAPSEK